jgi:hypothetical protein
VSLASLCRDLYCQHLRVLPAMIALDDADIIYSEMLDIDVSRQTWKGFVASSAAIENCLIDTRT